MEHDTEQQPSYGVSQECIRPSHHRSLSETESREHSSSLNKSAPTIQTKNASDVQMHPTAVSYHEGDIAKHGHNHNHEDCDWMNEKHLQRSNVISKTSDDSLNRDIHAPSLLPFATPDDSPPLLETSNVSMMEHDTGNHSSLYALNIDRNRDPPSCGERSIGGSISVSSSEHILHGQSITNSKCVPVEGRLIDLSDHDTYSKHDDSDADEGGIVILDESTEEEFEESIRESLKNDDRHHLLQNSSQIIASSTTTCIETQSEITQASMYENNSIVLAAAARVNANPIPLAEGNESLGFEQLLQEADDHYGDSDRIEEEKEDSKSGNRTDSLNVSGRNFWRRNPFSSFNTSRANPMQPRALATRPSPRTSVRATRIRHDKYIVEIDIVPSDATNSRLDIRDAMDIMANMELLHLWFDPVPAVFDATVKDGSGNSMVSPRSTSSPSNSLEVDCANNNRQYDGQWVEISTPPLTIPTDSRISGCLRAIRVGFRSIIGFPARIRSMIFVERSSGRIGMTLGPYPDGLLCFQSGTMAYHTFNIRMSDYESGTADNSQCIMISDEVRLQRGGDEDFNGTRRKIRSCCICSVIRFILRFLEWALFFRWYQPDLASYMQQTISSMEKLGALVERGESAAYAGGELIIDGDDWGGENANNETMGTPLIG
eukprot:CAMPEP_0172304062 /NCGR_PEP_ID=MMETSP1058-20130122/5519_1 /TAXON_ID=83371 /ORGANISM="Detonula confervacea, Strain CCMP 353" /LENGTH=658 /DNA_ID=CAMNT_0013015135 /DNA_START=44 /DNA_END=2020 /DNA_ORIENTATION=+